MALHPNAVRSPSTNFQDLGVEPEDVLEIESGPNEGNYVIRVVLDNLLFLDQQLPSADAGPVSASIRKKREKTSYRTAAIIINQPTFNAGVSEFAVLDMLVVT
jgi:hypothetical protein